MPLLRAVDERQMGYLLVISLRHLFARLPHPALKPLPSLCQRVTSGHMLYPQEGEVHSRRGPVRPHYSSLVHLVDDRDGFTSLPRESTPVGTT